jgi:alpha-N-arabinofuranosidase
VELSGRPEPLDVVAAWTDDRSALTVAIVNPTWSPHELPFELKGAKLTGTGMAWSFGGVDDEVHNIPGREPRVNVEEKGISGMGDVLSVGPASLTLYRLDVGHSDSGD